MPFPFRWQEHVERGSTLWLYFRGKLDGGSQGIGEAEELCNVSRHVGKPQIAFPVLSTHLSHNDILRCAMP